MLSLPWIFHQLNKPSLGYTITKGRSVRTAHLAERSTNGGFWEDVWMDENTDIQLCFKMGHKESDTFTGLNIRRFTNGLEDSCYTHFFTAHGIRPRDYLGGRLSVYRKHSGIKLRHVDG
jgi:hypothetical protein